MKSAVPLWVLVLSLTIISVRSGNDEMCPCPSESQSCQLHQCPPVKSTVNITLKQLAHSSPMFVELLPSSGAEDIDSICNTFYKIDDHTYYLVEYTVLKNGSVTNGQYIMSDIPGSPGKFKFTGTRGTRYQYGTFNVIGELGSPCPTIYALHLCNQLKNENMPWNYTTLSVARGKTSPGEKCLGELQAQVAAQGYDTSTGYYRPPQKNTPKCITRLNGAKSINAHLVHPDHHASMPEESPFFEPI